MTCHDIATDDTPPKEPVTNFRLTEWAVKNWAIVAFILMIIGSGMNAYGIQFVNAAGVTRKEYEQTESRTHEQNRINMEFQKVAAETMRGATEVNARQDAAIAGLQQAVTDIKDDNKEIKQDIKTLLKLVK